jgi:GTPase-activating protein BEM2
LIIFTSSLQPLRAIRQLASVFPHIIKAVTPPILIFCPLTVFGVDLQFLLQREAPHGEVQPGTIPIVMQQCLQEIESRGLSEVGICTFQLMPLPLDSCIPTGLLSPDRIAGATSEVNGLKDAFNKGE